MLGVVGVTLRPERCEMRDANRTCGSSFDGYSLLWESKVSANFGHSGRNTLTVSVLRTALLKDIRTVATILRHPHIIKEDIRQQSHLTDLAWFDQDVQ